MSAIFKEPLNSLQIELVEMFAKHTVSDEDIVAIKKMLSNYFSQKAMDEADALWEKRAYTQDTMSEWLQTQV